MLYMSMQAKLDTEAIRRLCSERGWRLSDLHREMQQRYGLKTTRASMSQWRHGQQPQLLAVIAIVELLGATFEDVLVD